MKRKNLRFIIGGVLIVAIAAWIFGSISSENLTYYYTPSEALSNFDQFKNDNIRVMGFVKEGSLNWFPKDTKLEFQVTDETDEILNVEYTGAKPDMFKEGQGVVVEGSMIRPGFFLANTLLVKHSEDYKVTDHDGKQDYTKTLQ